MKRRRLSFKFIMAVALSRGAFIRLYGREAWASLPRRAIVKDGKRAYITQEAFLDNVWLAAR